jgi:hypothetical protein
MEKERAGEIWADFCSIMEEDKNISEAQLKEKVKNFLRTLGFSSYKGEIECERNVRSTNKRVDIVLKNNNKDIIAIELKKPSVRNSKNAIKQLFHYMLPLGLKFGIFIGDNLQFCYKDNNTDPPKSQIIFKTDFIENNDEAIEFISLIGKPFDEKKMAEFCEKRILREEDEEKFNNLKDKIEAGDLDKKAKNMFIEFLKKSHNEPIANKISNEIEIRISLKNPSARNEKSLDRNNHKNGRGKRSINEEIDKTIEPADKEAGKKYAKKRPQFKFMEMGISIGETISFVKDERIRAKVIDGNLVEYDSKEYSLTELTSEFLGYTQAPLPYWKHKGKLLSEYYDKRYGKFKKS